MSGMPDTPPEYYAHYGRMSTGNHALLVKLGKRIQALRKKKGWTQTDMAAYLDMNRGHISDIERGKREVGIITLQIIARGLDTTMANLMKGL
jgi:transcriptional regulator with XRE-family HTH domain